MKKPICILLSLALLAAMIGCGGSADKTTAAPDNSGVLTEEELNALTGETELTLEVTGDDEAAPEAMPMPEELLEAPAEEATPELAAPASAAVVDASHLTYTRDGARAAQKGDIAPDFPDYDTGAEADWSYQSDELRVAITKNVDEENGIVSYVADVWVKNIRSLSAAIAKDDRDGHRYREDAESISTRKNAVLGMTGDYMKHLVVRNGELLINKISDDDILELFEDGTMEIVSPSGFNAKKAIENGLVQAWQFDIDERLVHDGKPTTGHKTYGTRHPRCMIGYYSPGHYVLVTVDGRSTESLGMNAYEMVEFMSGLGVEEAYNLDGGTSAIMTFMGQIINVPSGTSSGESGRTLTDMIILTDTGDTGTVTFDEIRAQNAR